MNCSSARCTGCKQCEKEIKPTRLASERAVECFGPNAQMLKVVEESCEFNTEAIKAVNGKMDREKLKDEYVDLFMIMAPQMKEIMINHLGFTYEELIEHAVKKNYKLEKALAKEGYGCV